MILYTLHLSCSGSLVRGSMVSYILGIGGGNSKYVTSIGRVINLGYANIFVGWNIPRKPLSFWFSDPIQLSSAIFLGIRWCGHCTNLTIGNLPARIRNSSDCLSIIPIALHPVFPPRKDDKTQERYYYRIQDILRRILKMFRSASMDGMEIVCLDG